MNGEYSNRVIDGVMCTWLQSCGWYPTVKLSEVQVGQTLVYNYGSTSRVVAVEPCGKASIRLTVESDGKQYTTTKRAATLVACREAYEAYKAAKKEA